MSLRRPKNPTKPPNASKPKKGMVGTAVADDAVAEHAVADAKAKVAVTLPDGPVSGSKTLGVSHPVAPCS